MIIKWRQKNIKKEWHDFVAKLRLPTYGNLKYFGFYDSLVALIRFSFAIRHERQFVQRVERISLSRDTGLQLSKWDAMKEDTP